MLPTPTHRSSGRAGLPPRRPRGFTLIELVTILAVVGVLVAIAVGSMEGYSANQRLNASAREIATVFSYARGEAIRTGNIHLVSLRVDINGNPIVGGDALVHDDGLAGSLTQNCAIDVGEPTRTFDLETGITFGVSVATAKVATDPGAGALGMSSFEDAAGAAASWVMFRPEGLPVAYSADCSTGPVGTGGGGIYLTNGQRDVAVVVSPIGATRTHVWNARDATWTD